MSWVLEPIGLGLNGARKANATRPAQEVEGPSAQPAFELQFRVGPSGMGEALFLGLVGVKPSVQCDGRPNGAKVQNETDCSMGQSGSTGRPQTQEDVWLNGA